MGLHSNTATRLVIVFLLYYHFLSLSLVTSQWVDFNRMYFPALFNKWMLHQWVRLLSKCTTKLYIVHFAITSSFNSSFSCNLFMQLIYHIIMYLSIFTVPLVRLFVFCWCFIVLVKLKFLLHYVPPFFLVLMSHYHAAFCKCIVRTDGNYFYAIIVFPNEWLRYTECICLGLREGTQAGSHTFYYSWNVFCNHHPVCQRCDYFRLLKWNLQGSCHLVGEHKT